MLIIHGAGGHVGALWPFTAVADADDVEVMALDLPLYGRTESPHPAQVRYRDWVDLLSAFVIDEQRTDPRPLVLFGASMGGMLAYETAARTDVVAAVLATCLLDPGDRAARGAAARWALLGRTAPRTLPMLSTVAGDVRLPIRWLARMRGTRSDTTGGSRSAGGRLGGKLTAAYRQRTGAPYHVAR